MCVSLCVCMCFTNFTNRYKMAINGWILDFKVSIQSPYSLHTVSIHSSYRTPYSGGGRGGRRPLLYMHICMHICMHIYVNIYTCIVFDQMLITKKQTALLIFVQGLEHHDRIGSRNQRRGIYWVFITKSQLSETTYPDLTVDQVTAVCSEIWENVSLNQTNY